MARRRRRRSRRPECGRSRGRANRGRGSRAGRRSQGRTRRRGPTRAVGGQPHGQAHSGPGLTSGRARDGCRKAEARATEAPAAEAGGAEARGPAIGRLWRHGQETGTSRETGTDRRTGTGREAGTGRRTDIGRRMGSGQGTGTGRRPHGGRRTVHRAHIPGSPIRARFRDPKAIRCRGLSGSMRHGPFVRRVLIARPIRRSPARLPPHLRPPKENGGRMGQGCAATPCCGGAGGRAEVRWFARRPSIAACGQMILS
jgi:hypothetical protein